MVWIHNQQMRFKVSECRYKETDFPHLSIKINILFYSQESNYLISQDDSGTAAMRPLPFFSYDNPSTTATVVHVIARENLSYDDIKEAVGKPFHDHIQNDERSLVRCYNYVGEDELACKSMIDHVWEKVSKIRTKYVELNVDLHTQMKYTFMYNLSKGRRIAMAAPWVLPMEFSDGGGTPVTEACPICLAEIGSAAMFKMPNSHVFHAACFALSLESRSKHPMTRTTRTPAKTRIIHQR